MAPIILSAPSSMLSVVIRQGGEWERKPDSLPALSCAYPPALSLKYHDMKVVESPELSGCLNNCHALRCECLPAWNGIQLPFMWRVMGDALSFQPQRQFWQLPCHSGASACTSHFQNRSGEEQRSPHPKSFILFFFLLEMINRKRRSSSQHCF